MCDLRGDDELFSDFVFTGFVELGVSFQTVLESLSSGKLKWLLMSDKFNRGI